MAESASQEYRHPRRSAPALAGQPRANHLGLIGAAAPALSSAGGNWSSPPSRSPSASSPRRRSGCVCRPSSSNLCCADLAPPRPAAHEIIVIYVMILVASPDYLARSAGALDSHAGRSPTTTRPKPITGTSSTTRTSHPWAWSLMFATASRRRSRLISMRRYGRGSRCPGAVAKPIAAWMVIIAALIFAYACLASLLAQAVDGQREADVSAGVSAVGDGAG